MYLRSATLDHLAPANFEYVRSGIAHNGGDGMKVQVAFAALIFTALVATQTKAWEFENWSMYGKDPRVGLPRGRPYLR